MSLILRMITLQGFTSLSKLTLYWYILLIQVVLQNEMENNALCVLLQIVEVQHKDNKAWRCLDAFVEQESWRGPDAGADGATMTVDVDRCRHWSPRGSDLEVHKWRMARMLPRLKPRLVISLEPGAFPRGPDAGADGATMTANVDRCRLWRPR
jgi:hypothetical protein